MAVETPCQTPGAVYGTTISPFRITIEVQLPGLYLQPDESDLLVDNLHNAVELCLARYFR